MHRPRRQNESPRAARRYCLSRIKAGRFAYFPCICGPDSCALNYCVRRRKKKTTAEKRKVARPGRLHFGKRCRITKHRKRRPQLARCQMKYVFLKATSPSFFITSMQSPDRIIPGGGCAAHTASLCDQLTTLGRTKLILIEKCDKCCSDMEAMIRTVSV